MFVIFIIKYLLLMINDDIFALFNQSYNKSTANWTIRNVKIYNFLDKSKKRRWILTREIPTTPSPRGSAR